MTDCSLCDSRKNNCDAYWELGLGTPHNQTEEFGVCIWLTIPTFWLKVSVINEVLIVHFGFEYEGFVWKLVQNWNKNLGLTTWKV